MGHQLHIRVRDNELDSRYIYVTDYSDYDPLIPVKERTLRVLLPGFERAMDLIIPYKGTSAYTNRTFGLSTSRKDLGAIQDGLYTFTFSVSPNQRLSTVVYHFRTALLEAQLYEGLFVLMQQDQLALGEDMHDKQISRLLEAQLIIGGMKRLLQNDGDLRTVTIQYQEAVRIIQSVTKILC